VEVRPATNPKHRAWTSSRNVVLQRL